MSADPLPVPTAEGTIRPSNRSHFPGDSADDPSSTFLKQKKSHRARVHPPEAARSWSRSITVCSAPCATSVIFQRPRSRPLASLLSEHPWQQAGVHLVKTSPEPSDPPQQRTPQRLVPPSIQTSHLSSGLLRPTLGAKSNTRHHLDTHPPPPLTLHKGHSSHHPFIHLYRGPR